MTKLAYWKMKVALAALALAAHVQAVAAERPVELVVQGDARIARLSAETFAGLWKRVTGTEPRIVEKPSAGCDLVVFGSTPFNRYTFERTISGELPADGLRNGSDAYRLLSRQEDGRTVLYLLNARPRALLYAVYRFFELRADCAWFWDEDRVPQGPAPDLSGLDITESPRFEWRGLRYFAHRSLHRFQAEHWNLDDWKKEIDWIVKRRLNFYLLRIGQDDFFQLAFPDAVPYPEGYDAFGGGPNKGHKDRTLFWPLKVRAKLRKELVRYAQERDLVQPVDTGTMTHWYSRTPQSFLDNLKPAFLDSFCKHYTEPQELVWDIRQDRWMDAYWRISQAVVDNYDGPAMFHTVALGERNYYGNDHRRNFELKWYNYRRISATLREHYPNAPLLVGTWDFRDSRWWKPEYVRKLVDTLDPANTIIFDYIADLPESRENNFVNWGVVGRFPWMFGIFHAYEAHNDLRGNYPTLARRIPIAAADPMCKGLFYWPETSHSDILMLDYFPAMAWDPSDPDIGRFLAGFCRRRYGVDKAARMEGLWRRILPALPADSWHLCIGSKPLYADYPAPYANLRGATLCDFGDKRMRANRWNVQQLSPHEAGLIALLEDLSAFDWTTADGRATRDAIDLARSAESRLLNLGLARLALDLAERTRLGRRRAAALDARIRRQAADLRKLLHGLADLLESSPEYSLNDSLAKMRASYETNPDFERTLKENGDAPYCRAHVYEPIRRCAEETFRIVESQISSLLDTGDFSGWPGRKDAIDREIDAVHAAFKKRPLSAMAPDVAAAAKRRPAALAAGAAAARRPAPPPDPARWVVLNEDCNQFMARHTQNSYDTPITRATVNTYVDQWLKGPVTHYFVNINGQTVYYDSKVFDQQWQVHRLCGCREGEKDPRHDRFIDVVEKMAKSGFDHNAAMIARAREKGVIPWISIRMNDIHGADNTNTCATSFFARRHPEFWRRPGAVPDGKGNWARFALDYSHKEVRELMLAFIKEALERYDADGIELDWMRFANHLTPGREREQAHCLTEVMRRTKALVDEVARRRGHPVQIGARVTSRPDAARAYGTDFEAWAREGLIDVLIMCNFWESIDFGLPMADWRKIMAAANPRVKVIAGCDQAFMDEGHFHSRRAITYPEYCGWLERMFAEGADGFYFFNHFDIARYPNRMTDMGRALVEGAWTRERFAREARAYPVSFCDSALSSRLQARQTPCALSSRVALHIPAGTPPEKGTVAVAVGSDRPLSAAEQASVRLNGIAPEGMVETELDKWIPRRPTRRSTAAAKWTFPLSALKSGDNVVSLDGSAPGNIWACEIFVTPEN